ncbi:methylmalonyl-CoA mutase family protein [Spirosoma gilvum]
MESLFSSSFPPTDKSAWLAQVQKELKDANAYESLRWHTDEGFTLEPYYTADDLARLPLDQIQRVQKQVPGWLNAPELAISDEKTANLSIRTILSQGAEALVVQLRAKPNLAQLLNGIKLAETPVYFRFQPEWPQDELVDFINSLKTIAPYQLKGGLLTNAGKATPDITRLTADSPQFQTVCVSGHDFHQAGATATQELAFMLASLVDQYDQLTEAGLTIEQLVPKTILSVSIGTSYFLEVAKLRALRVLIHRLLSHYSLSITHYSLPIHCQTSTFYDSRATVYTNMLRATSEAMAAVIGGSDVLTIHGYNTVLGESNEFSERIARNISVLLKEESYLSKVADPSAGSYYIESLTHQLIEAAWALFLAVEQQGGMAKATADGFIRSELERAYQHKIEAVKNGKVLVGVNKFRFDEPNPTSSKSTDNLETTGKRLAETFE